MKTDRKKLFLIGGFALIVILNALAVWKEVFIFPAISVFALLAYLLIYRLDILLYLIDRKSVV